MASGVSGRESVSPTNDETYQSPGASQDDGIDNMLARYSGLVEGEFEEEEGEGKAAGGKKGGGGGEPGMHRNHAPKGAARVSQLSPIAVVPVNPQSTLHTLTPSPRHAVSAPVSQQTTPAHDSEGRTPLAGGATGQAGFSGDVRSFSWDNLASGAVAAVGKEASVNYPTTAAEIIVLLRKKICFLSGGRAKEGQSLITFPAKDKNFEYNRDDLRKVIQYLASIPMEDVREYGFSVIVDARTSSWHSTKLVLHSLQEVLPGQVHVVYIIQPSHFWQKQATTRGHNKEKKKNRLEFTTMMLADVDKLKRHIDSSQVTFDLGGYLPYNHDDWIKLRWDLEHFIASFNALMEHTSHVEQQLHMEQEGGDVETAEDALTRHIQIQEQLRKAPQNTVREGNELLSRLEQGRDDGGTSSMTPDKINAVSVIRRLLESMNRRQTQMDDLWRERRGRLEQTLELRVFEKALQKVRGWLKARGEETLSSRCDIGDSLNSAQTIHEQHDKFEAKAKSMYSNLTQLRRMADRFAGSNHFAADTLQRQVAKISSKFSRFETHLAERRRIVVGSLRFHSSYTEWHTHSDRTAALLKADVSAPDGTSVEQLLSEHSEVVSQLQELGATVEKEGQDLLDVIETVTRRTLENRSSGQVSRPGPDYSVGIEFVESSLEEVRKKRHRVVQLAEARRLTLQQCKQLHNCESDARQVTTWLSDISAKLATSHGDIGTSKETVEKLLKDHDKQAENAKKTYRYGCDLLSAAQKSRQASRLEEANNSGLVDNLTSLWAKLSGALVEARARLEVAQQFHHLADEVMECYSRWTTPIHNLPKSPPTVEARLQDIAGNKDKFIQKISECLKVGTSLLDRMCRPLTSAPAYRNLNEPTKQSLAFLRSRLQEIEHQTVGLQSILSRQESVLREFLVYCQFEHDMEQVLVWMQDQGLKSMQRFSMIGETASTVQSQLILFDTFNFACQEQGEQVERLVAAAPKKEAEITGFKSDLTKKTASLSAVWGKFSSRLREREKALRQAATFYERVSNLQSLAADLESQLSADMLSLKSPLKPYLNDLASKHASMASLFHEVSQNGAALTELFKPTNEGARDNGRAGHISSQISTLNTHCQRVEQLWSDAWGRVGGGKPARPSKTSSQSRQASDVGQPAVKVSQRIPSVASKTGKEITAKASVTRQTTASKPQQTSEDVARARQTVGTSKTKHLTSPPMRQSSAKESEVLAVKASPKRQTPSSKRRSEMYGDLEAEAYKHLERLESECAQFHSTHSVMGDDVESVSDLRDQYLKFIDIIAPTCSSIEEIISLLCALKSDQSQRPTPSLSVGVDQLCEGLRKRVGWWKGGFAAVADTLNIYLVFTQLAGKVDSDLQSLEDILCETVDTEITMETAQSMLDQYQPLVSGLKKNYPAMKELGEMFLQITSKMASEKTTPQLQVGGACTSVAVAMGGVEGRYPDAMEGWSQRERQLTQTLEWLSFHQNCQQLSAWIKEASESFLVRFDLGTSLVTTEDLEMEFQEFKTRAQVTSKEVNALLAQSDQMLAENHFAAPQLREEVWNLRELLEDFTARTKEREKTLHEAADFFRNTEKLENDMQDAITQCTDSTSTITLNKERSLASVSSRLVNLQTSGANLISLGEGKKKGSVRGRKRKLIRSDSSGATEFSLKQILTKLQTVYSDYQAALGGRRRASSVVSKKTEVPNKEVKETVQKSPVVLRKKNRTEPELNTGRFSSELKKDSTAKTETKEAQVRGRRLGDKDTERRSTISSRSATRQVLKAEKQQSEPGNFQRSFTLPGHFRGRRAPTLSVLQKAAAFSQVTEGSGLAAPFGLNPNKAIRRRSWDGRELQFKTIEDTAKPAAQDKTISTTTKPVQQPVKGVVQTAVVRTVISEQEPAKRVSVVNIDMAQVAPEDKSRSPSISPIPFTRVVSPSSVVLPSEHDPPPRVVSPVTNRSNRKKSPVTTTVPVSSSSSLAATAHPQRRSIQNLKISGKVSHLKHMFDRQEEESGGSGGGSAEKSPEPPAVPPKSRRADRHRSPDIVPKVVETAEEEAVLSEPLMADKPFVSREIEETSRNDETKENIKFLAPPRPESPQNYTPSPEPSTPPPRPPSPIGYILEDMSDGGSSYESYDTEYSDDEEEEEEEEEGGEGGDMVDGGVEEVDSGSIGKRTIKTLQAVTLDLVSNELSYLHSLETLAESYLPAMEDSHIPSFLQGRASKIFANIADIYEVHRTFYAEINSQDMSSGPAILESFCHSLVRDKDKWNQYQTYLLNMEQGQRILSQYGGTFFQEVQRSIGDHHSLEEHFVKPRDQLVKYDRLLRDVVMCAQKEYLHGVGIAKDALRVIQSILHATNNAMAVVKLRGCPISLDKTSLIMAEQFNMYTTEKKKVVREMVVFLHHHYIIFAVDLMEGKEYDYWEHIETTDLHLIETYKSKEDRFALSPCPPTTAHYLYVLQPLSLDSSVKEAWVTTLRSLVRQGARGSTPLNDAVLPLPYHFRQTDDHQEDRTSSLKRRGSLKRSRSLRRKRTIREGEGPSREGVKRTGSFGAKKELVLRRTGSLKRDKRVVNEPPDIHLSRKPDRTSTDEDLYVVVEDFSSEVEGFLAVKKGQLVEVLDQGGSNWLVLTVASAAGELEGEGFLPSRCLQSASKLGISRPTSVNTASSQPNVAVHRSHDQISMSGDQSKGSHDARTSDTSGSKRSGRSGQFISQLVEDIYYAQKDTTHTSGAGLLPLTYGQAVEVLDVSDGDLWLVKTVDAATGKAVDGLVRRSCLVSKPPPSKVPPVQNGTEIQQNVNMGGREPAGGWAGKVQLRGHPPPSSSATAAVMPGSLFGVYEPPRSMIFGKPHVNEREIAVVEQAVKKDAPILEQAPPLAEKAPPPLPIIRLESPSDYDRVQDPSVSPHTHSDDVETYVAIADFHASEESNISLKAGEQVQLLDSSRSDWWLVALPNSSQSGWVPAEYLEKRVLEVGRVSSPKPEPFQDETGEIERVIKRGHRLSQIQLSRHLLYQSPFLATPPHPDPDEPSPAQLEGVYSISAPYVASTEIQAQHTNQLSLIKDQPIRVLDGRRDDWWLVQTIPDYENKTEAEGTGMGTHQNGILPKEGWVPAGLLQPAQEGLVTEGGGPKSAPPFSAEHGQPLWTVLADYPGEEEGTISVNRGDLVEVIDISRNEWCLVRLVGRPEEEEEEGWVPAGFLKPYSGGGFAYPFPRFPPHMSPDESDDEESLPGDPTEPLPLPPLTPEPVVTPYPDPERRADAAKKRSFIVSELVTTEKDYVDKLHFCIQHYIEPAQAASAPKPLQTSELFNFLRKIFEFHRDHFLPELERCCSLPESLGSVFTSSEDRLQIYVAYCKCKAASHALLQEHRGFFEDIRMQLQDRLELADYLILPVSRITRWSLLLSDFRKQSARSALPAGEVDTALTLTRGISRQANNAIHLDMLEGFSKMEVGELVLLDTFHIQAGSKPGSKQRQVFLFPRCLLITKRERGGSYSIKEKLMLRDISVAPDMDPQKKNLIIYDMNSGTKFILTATTSSVREQWLSQTQKLIQAAKIDTTATVDIRGRSVSEPPELPPRSPAVIRKVTALKNSLVAKTPSIRLGSAKRPSSGAVTTPSPVPPTTPVAADKDELVQGSEYVVMECIVLEGGDDVQLEPGEVVTLVGVEGGGASLRVRTTDTHPTEGTVPATFLRKKTSPNAVDMEAAPKFTMLPTDLDLLYGTTATIACAFNGYPKPSIEWRMDRETVNSKDDRIKINSCATSSILEIVRLGYEDVGTYTCFITNSRGSNSAQMTLSVHGPPAKPAKPAVSKVTGTSVKLKWSAPEEDGRSAITTYQVEMLQEGFEDWQPIIQQPKTTFIVKALHPSTCYQFRVLACNEYGAGLYSDPSDMITTKGRGWLSASPNVARKRGDFPDGGPGIFDDFTDEGSSSNLLSPTSLLSPPTPCITRGSIHSEYDVLSEELGRGRFGIVHKCIHRQTGLQMVAKYVRLRSRKKAEIRREVEMCRRVTGRSPYLMEFHNAYERGKNLVIVTELVPGGELIERILLDNDLTEGVIVRYLSQLLAALDCLHQMNIAHLDIKPENILISGVELKPTIKLIDFGSAQELNEDVVLVASSSPEFSAPEIISQEGARLVSDMWSVGVLTYILLSGTSPFFSDNAVMVVDRIKEARYDFYGEQFDRISTEAKEFISALLQKNTEYRMSAYQAMQHDWIKTLRRVSVEDVPASPWPMARIDISRLKAFNARRKWHTTAVATDATAVFGPRSAVFSPIPPDFEELLGRQELPPSLYPDSDVDVNVARGSTISFQFQVSGQPDPTVVWEHGSQRMTSDGRVIIATSEGVTSLTIHEVMHEDEGSYVCCAVNNLGNTVQECQIRLLEPPSPPTEVHGVILGSYNNSALISWLSPNDGPCPITRYLLQLRRVDSGTKTWHQVADDITSTAHVVENLERGVAYVFRVCAMNEIGCGRFSQISPPLLITDGPDYESDGPEMEDVRRIVKPLELDS